MGCCAQQLEHSGTSLPEMGLFYTLQKSYASVRPPGPRKSRGGLGRPGFGSTGANTSRAPEPVQTGTEQPHWAAITSTRRAAEKRGLP